MTSRRYSPAAKRFLAEEVRKRPLKLGLFLLMSLAAAVLEVAGVALVFPLLFLLVDPGAEQRFGLLASITRRLHIQGPRELYIALIVSIGVLVVAKAVYMALFYRLQMRTVANWKTALSRRLMRMYLFSDFSVHMRKTSSEVIRNISLTGMLYDQFIMPAIAVLTNSIIAAGLIALLLLILPFETTIGVSVMAVSAVGVYLALRRRVMKLGEESNDLFRVRQRILQQSVGAIRETKILGKEGYFVDRFTDVERQYFANQRRYGYAALLPGLVVEPVVMLSLLGLVTYVIFLAKQPPQALATLGVLAGTMFRLAPQFNRILGSLQTMNLSRHALELLAGEIADLEGNLYIPPPGLGRLPLTRAVRLQGVRYRYPGAEKDALVDVSLEIGSRQFVGITGPSGAGKTTMLAILMGLLRPTEGAVLVDGVPLTDPELLRKWQNGIGYVSQSIFLVEDTLLRNIAYGVDDREVDMARATEAVLAQLDPVVARQPGGLHESVGEYGSRLSGGERQRVGIARALYGEPSFLAFDEATASLDVETERAVTDGIEVLRGQKTMVAIAHRLSTLRLCDRIVMMEGARVVGIGPFDALQASCPAFRRLVELSRLRKDGLIEDGTPATVAG